MLDISLSMDEAWTTQDAWEHIVERAVGAAVAYDMPALIAVAESREVSVRLAGNAEVHALNAAYRSKDRPTNVLSFPHQNRAELGAALEDDRELLVGDLILAHEICCLEAEERGIPLAEHVTHLVVHGTLHLLGHDHLTDADAEAMEALETEIMKTLGYDDPYRHDRSAVDG